jgi:protein-S-isoprenylcysteine O-methyltransferase Ste14
MLERKKFYPKLLVFVQFTLIGLITLFSKGFFSSWLSIFVFIVGVGLGIWALLHNRLGNFNIQPKMKEGAVLVTSGIYAYIRHPMYLSVIVMSFALVFSSVTLLQSFFFFALLLVLVLKAKKEESLWMEESEAYEKYRSKTKLFIPFIL